MSYLWDFGRHKDSFKLPFVWFNCIALILRRFLSHNGNWCWWFLAFNFLLHKIFHYLHLPIYILNDISSYYVQSIFNTSDSFFSWREVCSIFISNNWNKTKTWVYSFLEVPCAIMMDLEVKVKGKGLREIKEKRNDLIDLNIITEKK